MTDEPTPLLAEASAYQTVQATEVQPDDPNAPHDLNITLRCASEAAAYNILMDFASKMHLALDGMEDLPENRSLPPAGRRIGLITRGVSAQELGHSTVSMT